MYQRTAGSVWLCGFHDNFYSVYRPEFFSLGILILALFPGAGVFAFDRGVRFPALIGFYFSGWVFRTGHRTSVLFVGPVSCDLVLVLGQLVTSRHNHRYSPVCQINGTLNKASMWFVCTLVISQRRMRQVSCAFT